MADDREIMNRFFVKIFNRILACEESAIADSSISVNEIHIIEAVANLIPAKENTMKNIAASLSLSAGATSIAVNTLVNKEYLYRENGQSDRRKVFIFLTDKANKAEENHRAFHNRMITAIEKNLSEKELEALSKSLLSLEEFFGEIKQQGLAAISCCSKL